MRPSSKQQTLYSKKKKTAVAVCVCVCVFAVFCVSFGARSTTAVVHDLYFDYYG